ncbi:MULTISPECIES: TIGR03943 family protein [unclassified Paenibacillus]|uniref:TIGR03943 family putative permease subunit n=1 Tax=unclassified Paenibacillus TaxID=185978 RepID=UPI002407041A|nr:MULTISPECIES: TIGR03943 family protein [unclassified Paenibacillus]MDF9842235.1 putative membrane protein [Paenibacillus sp. PastF-2]MDF9848888.1 putative membrane protein [Paenibacillus sp. PastM-2]MDF9855458.1 putative membrane protein [Paenibacillus sp. PastF-1]MDH6480666.1 putative membrane protein [Paenibacillus sp. PastH-2]MDH6508153.1 putative membrane protein [Paenibacillus sp. PastM-3]
MNDPRSIRVHYLLRAVLLLGFALYIAHLSQQNALHYYVAPKLARWIRLCPVPLSLMAVSLGIQALFGKSSALCDCEHQLPRSMFKSTALYSLFLLPLLLGFVLPDRALGTAAAARKGVSLTYISPEEGREERFAAANPYQEEFAELAGKLYKQPVITVHPEIFSETFGAIDLYKEQFEGKEIAVSGFLYREQGAAGDSYAVSRFLVQCCTADATPFGILLDPQAQISLPADTWIEVRGKLHTAEYQGKTIVQIIPETVTPIPQPSTPYVYSNADSVAAWEQISSSPGVTEAK